MVLGMNLNSGTLLFLTIIAAGSACATHHLSSDYEAQEKELREQSQSVDKVMSSSSSILDLILTIKGELESVSSKIDIVNQAREEAHKAPSRLVSAFDRLCQNIRLLDAFVYQEQLKAMMEDLYV